MRRRAVREVVEVEVEVEEEGFGGVPLGLEMPLGWSVVILLGVDSMHQNAGLILSRSMLSAMEVGVASALICRGISALHRLWSVVHTSLNSTF